MPEPWRSRNTQGNEEVVHSSPVQQANTSRWHNGNSNRGGWQKRDHWRPRGGHGNGRGRRWGGQQQAEGNWNRAQDTWNNDTPLKPADEVDTPDPWAPTYPAEADWGLPQPVKKEPENLEELMKAQAHMHSDFVRDLIPFYLKTIEASEKGEPEVKLESYLEEMIQKRKASGWYWSLSDSGKKAGDGWSDHRASNNGWGVVQDDGWGEPATGRSGGEDWGRTQQDKGWADPTQQNDGWGIVSRKVNQPFHGVSIIAFPFPMRIEQGFQPAPFPEQNVYLTDPVLPSLLERLLPKSVLEEVQPDLQRLGDDVVKVIRPLASSPLVSPPTVTQYDQWGRRIDALQTSEGWRKLKAIAQKEGIPGIFYERLYGEHSRVYGFAKILLMVGDTQEVFCPLSMTDGAARILEKLGKGPWYDVYERLISRDPAKAFTAGQWMTERPGGSDVSQTETVATSTSRSHSYGTVYSLNGVKWFSSATDSEISLALARTGSLEDGSRGLSLFLVPLRLPLFPGPSETPSPVSNNIFLHRLKNKIGTHALPTAELSLEDTEGYLVSPLNKGVKSITPVLNITRVWSAVTSTGHLRKCLEIAVSYAGVRRVGNGKELLKDNSVHVERLAKVSLLYRALTHLVFGVVQLMGRVECREAGAKDESLRLRMLTPVVKAFAAEKASGGMEEAMAALGGAGYMEENGFGRAIRDALVEK
ncbi:hypothetical protein H1R20_g15955, partial [Candolleomyces eurysporus]